MEMQYFKDYSPALGRDMECKIYGHAGRPMLYIPCQDGRFFDFEDFHMADTLAPWIESGQIMVLSIDTLDKETWSDTNGDPYWRIRRYEQWLHYIVDEAVPKIRCLSQERNGWDDLPGVIAFGCSLGATHAVNLYLRRPDIFCGCLALSGIYTANYGFGGYMDELVYMNSPVDYMANLGPSLIISGMISSCSLRVIFSVSRARIKRRVIVRIAFVKLGNPSDKAASRSAICGYNAVRFL